jgi:hypothetical protein
MWDPGTGVWHTLPTMRNDAKQSCGKLCSAKRAGFKHEVLTGLAEMLGVPLPYLMEAPTEPAAAARL